MAKLEKKLMIYDPGVRTERGYNVSIEGPELVIDALDREHSCLDVQILAEAAASAKSGTVVITVKAQKPRR